MPDLEKIDPEAVFVVMHTAVANFVRGCRVRIGDLYHEKHPTREAELRRLLAIGAIKPADDHEAQQVPVTQPATGAAPIIMAGAESNLTPLVTERHKLFGSAAMDPRNYPGATADETSVIPSAQPPEATGQPAKDAEADLARREASVPEADPPAMPAEDAGKGGKRR